MCGLPTHRERNEIVHNNLLERFLIEFQQNSSNYGASIFSYWYFCHQIWNFTENFQLYIFLFTYPYKKYKECRKKLGWFKFIRRKRNNPMSAINHFLNFYVMSVYCSLAVPFYINHNCSNYPPPSKGDRQIIGDGCIAI